MLPTGSQKRTRHGVADHSASVNDYRRGHGVAHFRKCTNTLPISTAIPHYPARNFSTAQGGSAHRTVEDARLFTLGADAVLTTLSEHPTSGLPIRSTATMAASRPCAQKRVCKGKANFVGASVTVLKNEICPLCACHTQPQPSAISWSTDRQLPLQAPPSNEKAVQEHSSNLFKRRVPHEGVLAV